MIKRDDLVEEIAILKEELKETKDPVVEKFLKFRQESISEQLLKKPQLAELDKEVFVGLPSYNIYVRKVLRLLNFSTTKSTSHLSRSMAARPSKKSKVLRKFSILYPHVC